MLGNLYDALRAASVPEDKARKAAEELAGIVPETSMIATKADLAAIKTDVAVLKWMVGFNLAMTVAIVAKLFLGH
jgi:hypothetical protein